MKESGEIELKVLLARLLANIKTRKRKDPITSIAKDIIRAEKKLGSLKELSELLDVSVEMLERFLKVNSLSPDVKKLVAARKIDSVEIVNHLSSFNFMEQKKIAKELLQSNLNTVDVKAIREYKNSHPNADIDEAIKKITKSKTKKIFILYFYIPDQIASDLILEKFEKLINKEEILYFNAKEFVGKIKVTEIGLKRLRVLAKQKKVSLREYIEKHLIIGLH